ncbi:unnamed protein product [Rhizoctonia solani]|uniref:HAT C-terminal dimerisation domain-containing protein n=1 Tax=Rhizoctonia solani TaxID=456999 RepID=A0A8H3DYH8_9AGAM|nr:unnamed protein product [Rhizoctonia solani]
MSSSTPYPSALGKRIAPNEPVRQRLKRHKGINALSDAEAEKHSDTDILNAFKQTLRSPIYGHYVPRLERHYDGLGNFSRLVIRFECIHDNPDHSPICRGRLRSSEGTHNLIEAAKACDRQRGVIQPCYPQASGAATVKYSVARHRAILALRCARNHRSFESVVDELHREEVELLRPGTTLPSSATTSLDTKRLYGGIAKDAALYLQQIPGALHLALDGWTAPTSESYLGVVVFWREENKIQRTILEFIRLTEAHTGNYLATQVHECLVRFGIEEKIMSVCMDNASNNETLVRQLKELVPTFRGSRARLRCLAHIVNLMAKAFMSLFSPPPKRTSRELPARPSSDAANQEFDADPTGEVDADKWEYDNTVVKGVAAEAISMMAGQGVNVSEEELASARRIMFKVAGLARRVNDSAELGNIFREAVDRDSELCGDARALTRRVVTRWNTDRASLNSHIHFRDPVQLLTSHPKHNLKKFALDDGQWDLASELSNVLEVFQEPTDRFSQSEVPLIHQVIPELLTLKARLEDIRTNAPQESVHPITRIAAQAALLVYEKYLGAIQESDIYVISVAMCPDRKLQWFVDRGYETKGIRNQAMQHFERLYAPKGDCGPQSSSQLLPKGNIWTQRHSSFATATSYRVSEDSIEAYFNSPCVPSDVIAQHGGILGYWHHELKRRPALAQMALDFLTAPATSVDAERAFSGGRLMINHLQHQMSSQTFQAQMAIGSWYKTPLLPDVSYATRILEQFM